MLDFTKSDLKYNGTYRGLVMNNDDPLKQGRVQVKIYPMFDGIDTEYIPWSVPAMSLFDGAGDGFSCLSVPKEGSFVFTFFENGDVYQPVYFAEAQTKTYGIPSESATNYPNRKVWKTENGIRIVIDDTEDSEFVLVEHPIGSYIKIDALGVVTVAATAGLVISAGTGAVINSVGDLAMTSLGTLTLTSTGKATITSSGEVDIIGSAVNINP